jgi:hypothetical protein
MAFKPEGMVRLTVSGAPCTGLTSGENVPPPLEHARFGINERVCVICVIGAKW